ncbi:hypothetical protein NPIL_401191 [Nephila pilipes]|uniref:Uncharacterized protein n=1 Tax=Nephila pilipes TaxID=299642 RepID=A0A8X6IKC7_NEPPI|nr:hypothetical protein NPIL_401191 [Nephila pilipes]
MAHAGFRSRGEKGLKRMRRPSYRGLTDDELAAELVNLSDIEEVRGFSEESVENGYVLYYNDNSDSNSEDGFDVGVLPETNFCSDDNTPLVKLANGRKWGSVAEGNVYRESSLPNPLQKGFDGPYGRWSTQTSQHETIGPRPQVGKCWVWTLTFIKFDVHSNLLQNYWHRRH